MKILKVFSIITLVLLISLNLASARLSQLHRQILQEENVPSEVPAPEPEAEGPIAQQIRSTPKVPIDYQGTFGGYITIPSKPESNFFYSVVPAVDHKPDSPLLLYINGGPGYANQATGIIGQTGPYNGLFRNESDQNLYVNEYSWNRLATVIYLDQPLFVGYSFSDNPEDQTQNSTANAKDIYEFVVEFYKKYPSYASPNFYISGISYGGAYVPPLAYEINERNKQTDDIKIPLKGIILQAPLTNPFYGLTTSAEYLLSQGIIGEEDVEEAQKGNVIINTILEEAAQKYDDIKYVTQRAILWQSAYTIGKFANQALYIPTRFNNDIRIECPVGPGGVAACEGESFLEDYINGEEFRNHFGVKNNTANNWKYELQSTLVNEAYQGDRLTNYGIQVQQLLDEDIRFLFYAGDKDYNVDIFSVEKTVRDFSWQGQEEFNKQPITDYTVRGEGAGKILSYGGLTYVEVFDAGHEPSSTQPENCFNIVRQFLNEEPVHSID